MPDIGGTIERVTDEDRLRGVRGCLLLPPVIVVMTIVLTVIGIAPLVLEGGAGFEGVLGLYWGLLTSVALLMGIGVLVVIKLLQERKSGKRLMIAFFGVLLVSNIVQAANARSPANIFEIILTYRGIAFLAAIIFYFLVSRRVRLTLVN